MFKCTECNYKTRTRKLFEEHTKKHKKEEDDEELREAEEYLDDIIKNDEKKLTPTQILIRDMYETMIHEKEKDCALMEAMRTMARDYKEKWQRAIKELEELKACHTQMSQNHLCKVCSLSLSSDDSNKSP